MRLKTFVYILVALQSGYTGIRHVQVHVIIPYRPQQTRIRVFANFHAQEAIISIGIEIVLQHV